MKKLLIALLLFVSSCKNYTKAAEYKIGLASHYSVSTNRGIKTSSGIPLCDKKYTVASTVYPLHTRVRVTNLRNGNSIFAVVTDRGPFATNSQGRAIRPLRPHPNRIVDVSQAAAKALGFHQHGVARVKVQKVK